MGFWNRLFGGKDDDLRLEREIQEHVAQSLVLMGMPAIDAASVAHSCIETAKEESRKAGRRGAMS